MELDQFALDFQQEVLARAENEDAEAFREDAFTELMIEYLCENGELDDGTVCRHKGYGVKINGYGLSMDEACLDLMVSHYSGSVPPENLTKTDAERAMKRLVTFFSQCLIDGFYQQLPESSQVFDLAYQIHTLKNEGSLSRIRLFLLTDCITKLSLLEDVDAFKINDLEVPVSAQVWDIERLFRWWSSGHKREIIAVDFLQQFGKALPCLAVTDSEELEYNTFLALFPGTMLCKIYESYGPRLLERNVRSFLQVKGNVNQAIRRTIRDTPRMFLAYNNGLSATAQEVDLITLPDGGTGIAGIKDFQIVNGGQTTASIYYAVTKDKADVDDLYVQMKLTVLKDPEKMDDVVPRISESANTQNKVQTADFSANHPFHRKMEELSRTVWAPSPSGTEKQTHWFYERARGQYADERARAGTTAKRRDFEAQNPKQQVFTKMELAKFEHIWHLLPHYVSEGSQKNFARFMVRLKEDPVEPDQQYFEELVAKALLFRRARKLVIAQRYGGHPEYITTYTLSWLCADAAKRESAISLHRLWQTQALYPELEEAIIQVSAHVVASIKNPPGGGNVTEWCKREACWNEVQSLDIVLPETHYSQLVSLASQQTERPARDTQAGDISDEAGPVMTRVKRIGSVGWGIILEWDLEKCVLTAEQRELVRRLSKTRRMTVDEAYAAAAILDECRQHGWNTA
jgi:hypothetical protein